MKLYNENNKYDNHAKITFLLILQQATPHGISHMLISAIKGKALLFSLTFCMHDVLTTFKFIFSVAK